MTVETAMVRAGWVLTALFALFMTADTIIKLAGVSAVEETLVGLGYPAGLGFSIGVMEAIVLIVFLVPRTTVLGALLYTALFGGAIASHLRAGSPVFSHLLFGVYLGLLCWGGLWLRDARLRALIPLRR